MWGARKLLFTAVHLLDVARLERSHVTNSSDCMDHWRYRNSSQQCIFPCADTILCCVLINVKNAIQMLCWVIWFYNSYTWGHIVWEENIQQVDQFNEWKITQEHSVFLNFKLPNYQVTKPTCHPLTYQSTKNSLILEQAGAELCQAQGKFRLDHQNYRLLSIKIIL